MSDQAPNLIESETWKAMEDFSSGIDTRRLPQTDELAGSDVLLTMDDGHRLELSFSAGQQVAWSIVGPRLNGSGEVAYDGVALAEGGYWIDIAPALATTQSLTVTFHPAHGWALVVHSVINGEDFTTETRVTQSFHPGFVGERSDAVRPHETRDLIGKRTLFRYSANHLYEHIYLSSRRFVWHNLVGEQRGHAAAELASTWKLEDGVYLFTWREEIIPVGTVFVFDYARGRSTGKFIGLSSSGEIANDRGGADIIEFGYSNYGEHQEPV
jgi:hypothetical protein